MLHLTHSEDKGCDNGSWDPCDHHALGQEVSKFFWEISFKIWQRIYFSFQKIKSGFLDLQQIITSLAALNSRNVFSHCSGDQKSETTVSAGYFLLEVLGEKLIQDSPSFCRCWSLVFLTYSCRNSGSASVLTCISVCQASFFSKNMLLDLRLTLNPEWSQLEILKYISK